MAASSESARGGEDGNWSAMLRSRKKLERDRGIERLKAALASGELVVERRAHLERELLELLASLAVPWEERHGAVMAATVLAESGASPEFCERLQGEIPLLLEHPETRVRMSAGEGVRG